VSDFARFLRDLFDSGRVQVELLACDDQQRTAAEGVIQAFVRDVWADELPGPAPTLVMEAAIQGAEWLYRGCYYLMLPDQFSREECQPQSWREPLSASVIYSIDVTLRFLPDLVRRARQMPSRGPLIQDYLLPLASAWPLSSAGVAGASVSGEAVKGILESPALATLYAERIVESGDLTRLDVEGVRRWVRAVLGEHPELNPEVAKRLENEGDPN
jgi:hypothetical protein